MNSQMLDAVNLDEARASDPVVMHILEATCTAALEIRNRLICSLSAEDGEWYWEDAVKYSKKYAAFMNAAEQAAENFENEEWILYAVMNKCAVELGEPMALPWHRTPPTVERSTIDAKGNAG